MKRYEQIKRKTIICDIDGVCGDFVSHFNKKEIAYENFWKTFLFYCGIIIVIIAMISIAFYNPHILGLKFASQVDEINYFLFFSLFTFIFLTLYYRLVYHKIHYIHSRCNLEARGNSAFNSKCILLHLDIYRNCSKR